LTAAIKEVADAKVGDTITDERRGTETPLPGFKPAQQVVFCGLFPADAAEFEQLRDALAKLHLNDASFTYETETSAALGFGFVRGEHQALQRRQRHLGGITQRDPVDRRGRAEHQQQQNGCARHEVHGGQRH